jgi:hypothetical protein
MMKHHHPMGLGHNFLALGVGSLWKRQRYINNNINGIYMVCVCVCVGDMLS